MKIYYLTDTKTWINYWNGQRWEPVPEQATSELLQAIKDHDISIHWRSNRVAEFVLPKGVTATFKIDDRVEVINVEVAGGSGLVGLTGRVVKIYPNNIPCIIAVELDTPPFYFPKVTCFAPSELQKEVK